MEGKATISQFREVSILDLLGRKEVELDTSAIKNLVEGKGFNNWSWWEYRIRISEAKY